MLEKLILVIFTRLVTEIPDIFVSEMYLEAIFYCSVQLQYTIFAQYLLLISNGYPLAFNCCC